MYQFLGGMGKGDIVVFPLSPFSGKIGGEVGVPVTDILGYIVKCVAQVSGATFFHVRIAIFELSGLVS